MIFRVKFSGVRRTEAVGASQSRPPPARVRLHPRTYQHGLWPLTQAPKEAGPRTAISREGESTGRGSRRDAVGDQDRRCSRRDALEDPKNSLRPIGNVLSLMNVCSGVTNCPKRASARPFVCQFRTSGSSPAGRKRTRKFGGVGSAFNRVSEALTCAARQNSEVHSATVRAIGSRCPKGSPRRQASRAVSCSLAVSCSRAALLRPLSPQHLPALPTTICRRVCQHG